MRAGTRERCRTESNSRVEGVQPPGPGEGATTAPHYGTARSPVEESQKAFVQRNEVQARFGGQASELGRKGNGNPVARRAKQRTDGQEGLGVAPGANGGEQEVDGGSVVARQR